MSAHTTQHIPAYISGKINNQQTQLLLDSGASCSVISREHVKLDNILPEQGTQLINADSRSFTPLGTTSITVTLEQFSVNHTFFVVNKLLVPVILGCDFMSKHGLVLDIQSRTAYQMSSGHRMNLDTHIAKLCAPLIIDDELPQALPFKSTDPCALDLPKTDHPSIAQVIEVYKSLFSQQIGQTNITHHIIETGNAAPVKIPPRPIPFHYVDKVQKQLADMVNEGIIRPSSSPWCAPAVYVPKQNGEIRICVDFVQLNRCTKKDSYPVPRADRPHQRLAGKKIFSKLDLQSAYWQFPMHPSSIEKTAFCPGPGYGLWEFVAMPYGLTGATQTCQRALDETFRECYDCVDNYVDDIIVFSDDMDTHIKDLHRVFKKLKSAGFVLRGSKCLLGQDSVTHLGFCYSAEGIKPSEDKTKIIAEWPVPKNTKELRSFLGLANFYRNFVPGFANISSPLNDLTSKRIPFIWTTEHQTAFDNLRHTLMFPPILDYPQQQDHFILTTDASDVGLGAVLSTSRGTVIEFASRALTSLEQKYTTSEKECLAIIWATRKFRHYLLGTSFTLETDHKPLEWLESHRQSHARSQRLERWSLELRAYDFNITYRPGKNNQCADALSRCPVTIVGWEHPLSAQQIGTAQQQDPTLSEVHRLLQSNPDSAPTSSDWKRFPLRRYKQLWSQLTLLDSVLYRVVKSPTMIENKWLFIVPKALQKQFLAHAHEHAGHQGMERTLHRLTQNAYWVGMARDIAQYCSRCVRCQTTKALPGVPAPLQPVIASRPWELVGVDVLKVPMSLQGNEYILVAQDYFSKWPFAVPMSDQRAERIVRILKDQIFTVVGPPEKLHSDQGRNFESLILSELCKAFRISKSRTTPYHPMGDGLVERMNRTLLNLLRTYTESCGDWEEHLQLLLFAYRTTKHSSMGLSPHEVLFGYNPPSLLVPTPHMPEPMDPTNYSTVLCKKLLELRELVEANIVDSACCQKENYRSGEPTTLIAGQEVLVHNPARGKLDPRWTGPWTVIWQDATSVKVQMGGKEQIVHINRVRPLLQEDTAAKRSQIWTPPLFQHLESDGADCPEDNSSTTVTTRSGRVVRPPERYGY